MNTDDFIVRNIHISKRSYFVVVASVAIHFTLGIVYTFGNMLPYLVSYFRWKFHSDQTPGSMIWLQSMLAGFPFAMMAGGYLERRFNARLAAFFGCFLYTGGLALCYYSIQISYFSLVFTLGIISSFGNGIAYNAILTQCQKWFPGRIGLISGLITAGFGSGAFLIAPLQTKLVNPDNYQVNSDGFFTQEDLLERVPGMFVILAAFFAIIQIIGLLFIAKPDGLFRITNGSFRDSTDLVQPLSSDSEEESLLSSPHNLINQHASSDLQKLIYSNTFMCLFLTLMMNGVWIQTMSGLYKAFGQQFIKDDFFLATVNSLAAVCNCLSRVAWGYVCDKFSYKLAMATACALGVFLMWTLDLVQVISSPFLFLIWICMMYFCVGATFSLLPYATHKSFGFLNFGVMYGYVQMSLTISGLVTALLSQFLLSFIGFESLFIIVGFTMFTSFIITLFIEKTTFGQDLAKVS